MPKIEKIIDELTKFEPELKTHKKDLLIIVKALIESRPNTKFDQKFAQNLKIKLNSTLESPKTINSNLNIMKKLSYLLSGVVLTLVVVSGGYYGLRYYENGSLNFSSEKTLISMAPTITEVADRAFGSIGASQQVPNEGMGEGRDIGIGGGGAEKATESDFAETETPPQIALDQTPSSTNTVSSEDSGATAKDVSVDTASDPGTTEPYIYPITIYKYTYVGDDFSVEDGQVKVLKRINGEKNKVDILSLLENFEITKLADISKFKNSFIEYLTISEDRDFGYSLYLSLIDGTLSFSQNYKKWPQCYEEKCGYYPLKKSDVPSDSVIISMAENFLKEYKIDLSKSFGEPIVNKYFENEYEIAVREGWEPYIPDDINITYPQKINDLEVYYDGGNKTGVDVNVNIRHKKVSSVWGLSSLNYESSNYDSLDKEGVLMIAEKGGMNGYLYNYQPYPGEPIKEIEVEIGTPTKGYMKYWNYKEGANEELLVEALIFPITEKPRDELYFYQQAVVVPLAEEIYTNENTPYPPLLKEAQ